MVNSGAITSLNQKAIDHKQRIIEYDKTNKYINLAEFDKNLPPSIPKNDNGEAKDTNRQNDAMKALSKMALYAKVAQIRDRQLEERKQMEDIYKKREQNLDLMMEFERLKEIENQNKEWDVKRILTKNNYLIHTDAIKNYILPDNDYYKNREWLKYAEEADILNVVIFNTTAKKWRDLNPNLAKKSNLRDYATINELTVLSNLESHNAQMIKEGKTKEERFDILSEIAKYQLNILNNAEEMKLIGNSKDNETIEI